MWPHLEISHFLLKSAKIADPSQVLVISGNPHDVNENAAPRGQAAQIVVFPVGFQWFRDADFQWKSQKHIKSFETYVGFMAFHEIQWKSKMFVILEETDIPEPLIPCSNR